MILKESLKLIFKFHLIILLSPAIFGQVGIGTNSPKGALDINSGTNGFVYPTVSLTSTEVMTIINPQTGDLVAGTTVYNTFTSNIGKNSVYPGIYVWNGGSPGKWIPQFSKRDRKLYEQNATLRTKSTNSPEKQPIPFPSNSFTPKYTGRYKVEVKVHYGGGNVLDPPNTGNIDKVNFNAQQGQFEFVFNGKTKIFTVKSYSAKNANYYPAPSGVFNNAASQLAYVTIENLEQSTPYLFNLTCDQQPAAGFINNGNSDSGRGYIRLNGSIKCLVEITYIGE